jgi:UDP-hydrolysing UDP-N-acetyl-D-glucosamine 2-epimerase
MPSGWTISYRQHGCRVTTRKVLVALTTRGNYAKMKSTMQAILADPRLSLQVVVGGGLVLDRYGRFEPILAQDGFTIDAALDYVDDADTLQAMARSASRCLAIFADTLADLRPDVVVVVADRYEALALAQAAVCMNVHIAHIEGGEVSGSIDERIRHAVTKLAHLHFVANKEAAVRVCRMGEQPEYVHVVGTPSLDQLADIDLKDVKRVERAVDERGRGPKVDLRSDYVVVSHHPIVTQIGEAAEHYAEIAEAVRQLQLPVIWILPNLDAGAAEALAPVASLQRDPSAPAVRCVGSLPFDAYATLLHNARCLIGNTSSGLREGAFLGVPVVNVGARQQGRARAENVVDTPDDRASIVTAVQCQIAHGRYAPDALYGDGSAGQRISELLASRLPPLEKTIAY